MGVAVVFRLSRFSNIWWYLGKVSIIGIVALWGDCMVFPTDQGFHRNGLLLWTSIWKPFVIRMTKMSEHLLFLSEKYCWFDKNMFKWVEHLFKTCNEFHCRISNFCFVHLIHRLLVFGILVTLVALFFSRFFPSYPSCLAKCKQRLRNIFVFS